MIKTSSLINFPLIADLDWPHRHHAKARCESDAERMDVHNGLLLSSLWDAAFDQGLISFDDEGRPIVSPDLSDAAMAALQPENATPLPLTPEHRARLAWHRTHLRQG